MDAKWYDTDIIRYDGTTMTWVNHRLWYPNEVYAFNQYARKILETKGELVEDWTPDDLAIPMYAFEIEPKTGFLEYEECGEMWVYSNGFLIAQTGNVYKCDIDFSDLMEVGEHDFLREVEEDDILNMSCFRPLAYANHKWNPDYLRPASAMDESVPDIEAAITEQYEEDGWPKVKVLLKNNSEKDWHYEENSIFVGIIVRVDGRWYHLDYDPAFDEYYATFPSYNKIIKAGEEKNLIFNLGRYGDFPSGDYCVIIGGKDGNVYNYACAPYRL